MANENKVHIIGIGENGLEGLTINARDLIEKADLLIGDEETLEALPQGRAERLLVRTDLDEVMRRIESGRKQRIVVLASGDPLFYGVARYLCDKLGKDRFEVIPHVSSMQLAFARVKESWEDAFLTNLANHALPSVLEQIRGAEKAGLFTTESCPPAKVARELLNSGIDYFTAYVCENLGSPDERVTHGELEEIAAQRFAPLNVMILVRKPNAPDRPREAIGRRVFGNPDDAFLQSKPKRGLLTPSEVRSMALAEMDLGPSSIIWDVGAGSGSVAIEAALLAPHGSVFAIEMDQEDHQLIVQNAKRFGVPNLTPVCGRAPEAWKDLPLPDAVFIGGSGQGISRLVEEAYKRLRAGGRLVATISSINNLAETHGVLHAHCPDVKVWMLNIARGNYQLERIRFESLNPVFLVSVIKGE